MDINLQEGPVSGFFALHLSSLLVLTSLINLIYIDAQGVSPLVARFTLLV